jgi:uncharacterized protein
MKENPMHFVIRCVDKAGAGEVRKANRDAHLAYLESQGDRVVAAGPTLNEAGDGMTGSLLILEFDDIQAAEAFCADDPYAKAGLFAEVTITPWRKVFPR